MTNRFKNAIGEEYSLFKLAVPHYDKLQDKLANRIIEESKSNNKESIDILEIGCGPGYTTLFILKADPRTKVTALDDESIMIDQAKEVLKSFVDAGRVRLAPNDALDFLKKAKDDSFDAIVSSYTLHNFKQDYRKQVLIECYRVLKKGCLFANADKYARDNKESHKEDLQWQIKQFGVYDSINRPDLKEMWTKHYLEDENPEIMMYEGASLNELTKLNYKGVKTIYRNNMEAIIIGKK